MFILIVHIRSNKRDCNCCIFVFTTVSFFYKIPISTEWWSIPISGQKVFVSMSAMFGPDVARDVRRRSPLPEVQVRLSVDEGGCSQSVTWQVEMQSGRNCCLETLKFRQTPWSDFAVWSINCLISCNVLETKIDNSYCYNASERRLKQILDLEIEQTPLGNFTLNLAW